MDFGTTVGVFFSSFGELFTPSVFALLLLGVVIGSLVGLLPGLGAIAAMALLLPFTFAMSPFEAFALLLGMYAMVATTGDLTSILVGVPGSPDSAALVVDGYPLAKKGQATRAMSAAVASGTIGAIVGAVALALAVTFILPVVLYIGSPETLMLTLLGISVVASVSGRSLWRGLAAGALGLLLSAVGPNFQTGITRYGFESAYLLDGIPLAAFAIGLFAIPELVGLHRSRTAIATSGSPDSSSSWQGVLDTVRHLGLVVRSSLIGVVMAVVPGVGGAVSQWVAYAHAKQSSKRPEEFGRGAIEGVLAPGATNNSREGGGLIPTVVVGIPSSGAMAVLLGAFLILGLNPGPSMLTGDLDITFFMVWVLVAANIIGSLLCFVFLKQLAKVTYIRGELIVPFIAILVFVGAASTTGQHGDLIVGLLSGLLGIWMRSHGWPIVPLLLGFVLGRGAETNLNISLRAYGWDWVTRPVTIGLFVLAVVIVVLSLRQRRKRGAMEDDIEADSPASAGGIVVGAVLAALGIFAVLFAQQWPAAASIFPQFVGIGLILCALGAVVEGLRARRTEAAAGGQSGTPTSEGDSTGITAPAAAGGNPLDTDGSTDRSTRRRPAETVVKNPTSGRARPRLMAVLLAPSNVSGAGWITAFAISIIVFGFTVSIVAFVGLYLRLIAGTSWLKAVLAAVVSAAFLEFAFVYLLGVVLPAGLLIP